MFWVYAIERDGVLVYIGMSKYPMVRLQAHRRRFACHELDIRLITGFDDRDQAYVFEQACIRAVADTSRSSLCNRVGLF